jgi:hypothetical protein
MTRIPRDSNIVGRICSIEWIEEVRIVVDIASARPIAGADGDVGVK